MKNETLKKPNVFVKKTEIFFLYQNQELQFEFFLIYEAVRFHLKKKLCCIKVSWLSELASSSLLDLWSSPCQTPPTLRRSSPKSSSSLVPAMGNTLDMQQTLVSPTHAVSLSLCEQSVRNSSVCLHDSHTSHCLYFFFNRRFSKLESALCEMHLFEIKRRSHAVILWCVCKGRWTLATLTPRTREVTSIAALSIFTTATAQQTLANVTAASIKMLRQCHRRQRWSAKVSGQNLCSFVNERQGLEQHSTPLCLPSLPLMHFFPFHWILQAPLHHTSACFSIKNWKHWFPSHSSLFLSVLMQLLVYATSWQTPL